LKDYETLEDVQSKLIDLYTGGYTQFDEVTCPNCKCLAIDPKDCSECGE